MRYFGYGVISMRFLSRWRAVASLIALGAAAGLLLGTAAVWGGPAGGPQALLTVYDDAPGSAWANWSWNTTVDLNNTSPVHGGTRSIVVRFDAAWAGFYLHADPAVSTGGYETLRFFIHGGSPGNQQLRIVANGDGGNVYPVTAIANHWAQIDVSLSTLGSPATLADLYWQDTTGGAQAIFYLDDIQLIGSGVPPTPAPPGAGPALSVDAQGDQHPISPYIYGMNFASESLAAELDLPVRRWGGNSTSRYNWQLDVHNSGSDWYYENVPDASTGPLPDGSSANQFVEQDRRTGAKTILTMPLLGWTPKRRLQDHPYDCGFNSDKYGTQQAADWSWDPKCGNGVSTNGNEITGNDPADTSVAMTTTFLISWINHLQGRYGTAANGGVLFYNLDNEPMLWNSTHRDVHPLPTTYDELRDRTTAYAAAIKQADPSAKTLGPVLWGWCAYFFSALDGCSSGGADYTSHGHTAFVPWYLQQLKAYEQAHGVRLVDYLDLHYYPQADGVALAGAGNAATQALRLRSTRSLWDPTYVDESWIGSAGWEDGKVRLIPRMKEWVTGNYSGTRLAITEYNWGALDHINGALAQADVLGIFGREGLDLATLWAPPAAHQPGAYAFRLYRNYDGQHHTFGDVSVRAASADQSTVAIYAARRSGDNALTIMAINKSLTQTLASTIALSTTDPITRAAVYRYSAANLNAIVRQPDQIIASGRFSATFPAQSITLFVTSPDNPLDQLVFLPVILK
jgi:hypothetical protein